MKRASSDAEQAELPSSHEAPSPSPPTDAAATATATDVSTEPYRVDTNFLKTTAKHILLGKPSRKLVTLEEDTLLFDAVEKMSYEKVISLPVMKKGQFIGFLDVLDIVKYAISLFGSTDTTTTPTTTTDATNPTNPTDSKTEAGEKNLKDTLDDLDQKSDKYSATLVSSLLPTTIDVSSLVILEDTTISQILEKLKTPGIHRVLVFPTEAALSQRSGPSGVITQSDIIRLLYHNNHLLDQVTLTPISGTSVPKPVKATVPLNTTLLNAFSTLITNNISAIAVTTTSSPPTSTTTATADSTTTSPASPHPPTLFCNLSASDIRGLGVVCPFRALALPIDKFFLEFRDHVRPPIVCSLSNWLVFVISKMVLFGIHRVWVCDEAHRVTHVVTMTDIIEYLHVILEEKIF